MNILLVNDDGISAPGLQALYDAVKDLGKISVVAPDGERSAISHGITLDKPIPVRKYRNGTYEGVAVKGTPADCVKLALSELLGAKPDLVISGINLGCNTGLNVIYSGTVGAAAEAVFHGIPGIAVSLTTYTDPNWEPAARFIHDTVKQIGRKGFPENLLLNINVPNVDSAQDIRGVKITEQGMAQWQETFDKRTDPKGRTYYWMSGVKKIKAESQTTDDTVLKNHYISVTPVQFNLTAYDRSKDVHELGLFYQK